MSCSPKPIITPVPVVIKTKTAPEIFESVSSSVVMIRTYDTTGDELAQGSGVLIGKELIATNCHVIENATTLQVVHQGQEFSATLRHSDWDRDVCTLTVKDLKAQAALVGSTKRLKTGARVFAIGAPKGLELTLSEGIISSLRPVESGHYLQISSPISPGSSGGGLFNEEGKLIGLTTFYLSEGQQLNFAVPVEWISELPGRHRVDIAAKQSTYLDWNNKALELQSANDWYGLLSHSLSWTKVYPEDADGWLTLGFALGKVEETELEIEVYGKVLRINPEYVSAWFMLGHAYDKAGQTDRAIESYQEALRFDPEYVGAWMNLGSLYAKSGQTVKAIESYRQALRINPGEAGIWHTLGNLYSTSRHFREAIQSYRQALLIDPENPDTWMLLGNAYIELGETDKAIDVLKKASTIDPDDVSAWYLLGYAYGRTGQTSRAIKTLQQALRLEPEHAQAWYYLGMAYRQSGQTDKVTEIYKRLRNIDPALADELFNKAVLP